MGARIWARRVSLVVMAVAVVVLVGWAARVDILTSFSPGPFVTRPASAAGILFCGASVWGLTSERSLTRRLGLVSALLAGAIGVEALFIHGLGFPALAPATLPRSPNGEHLTSIPTALSLSVASAALLLSQLRSPRALRIFDVMVLLTLALGLFGILSSLYGWYELSTLSALRAALPSGISLTALGMSIACLHPNRGLVRAVLDPSPGGALLRRQLPAAVLLLAGLGFLRRLAELNIWFRSLGSAPFVVAEMVGVVWIVAYSARSVRRSHMQREQTQRALDEEMRSHAALLHERELRYRLLTETAPQIVWTAKPDGSIDYLSPAWSRFTGEPEEHAQGWLWESYIHPKDVQRVLNAWRTAIERGEPYEMAYRARRHDDQYRWFLSRAIPARDSAQHIVGWYGADTDIHELHEAREALTISEARFRVALQDRDFIVWTQDAHLRYTWVYNPAHGYEPTLSLGNTDLDVLSDFPDDAARLHALKSRVLETGNPFSGQVPLPIQGALRFFEMRLSPLHNADGEVIGVAGAAYDITDRKRAEETLRDAQKFETIGQLAAGVAHDFNNLLTGIIGNASFALMSLDKSPHARTAVLLERVIEAGESAAVLTQQMLAYAGKGRFQVEPTNLHRIKDSLLSLMRGSVPSGIELSFEGPAELPLVRADASQLQQLLTNLLLNAVEAIGPAAGRISMSMRPVLLDHDSARALDVQCPADGSYVKYVQVEVHDDGPGMPAETLQRAFEPFFSTKFTGRGLGLSAAQGIARAHGGGIVARSEAGHGTLIIVTLPALADSTSELELAAPQPSFGEPQIFSGAGVLFVDDERNLREVAKLTLRDAGYRVWLAENGARALEIVHEQRERLDVIVLDMTMPVMNGAEAARQLRNERIEIPIVASSGYSEVETLERFGDTAPLFLRKPYRASDLLSKIATAIGQTRQDRTLSSSSPAQRFESQVVRR